MSTITLGELKDMIDGLIQEHGEKVLDKDVYTSCDYGDYSHTQQLVPLGDNQAGRLIKAEESAYSQSGLALPHENDEDDEDEDKEDGETVVLI